MKRKLLFEYEKRKNTFLAEKKAAEETLDHIYEQMELIETEMKQCAKTIKNEKENIAYHEKHPSFKSSVEIKLSQSAVKQSQEMLVTFGQLALTLQTKIDNALETFKQADKGMTLCDVCMDQLQGMDLKSDGALLQELETLLHQT